MKYSENEIKQKKISFRRLAFQSLPEMWSFQLMAGLILAVPAALVTALMNRVAAVSDGAVTTANIKAFLFSWRFPVVFVLGALLVFLYVVLELFVQIHLTEDILSGEKASIHREVSAGFRSLRKFFNPAGFLVLLYIFLAVPICGVGFSIGLTKAFYIPDFIMDVIESTPHYAVLYAIAVLLLAWFGYRSLFTLHAVLLDGLSPGEGRKRSAQIIKQNRPGFIFGMIKLTGMIFLVIIAAYLLFLYLPQLWLERLGAGMPIAYQIDLLQMDDISALTEMDAAVIGYRMICALSVIMGTYLSSIAILLCGAYFMLRFTRYYRAFTGKAQEEWLERPKKSRYWKKVVLIAISVPFVLLCSVLIGLFFDQMFRRSEPVRIIAHRAGGTMASENSVEGISCAIDRGCYGSEIDVQRTADGFYIINHDNDFKRLTGVARAPEDMTMDEIRELRIKDTTGNGRLLPVVTFEEMLDAAKGKELLFIELKGSSADQRMVDELVQIVKERDCVADVAFISLNYDIISYAETNYPEFLTGTLFFAGIGDVSRLNCDLLVMEEETAGEARISQVHAAGKKAIVWTVNTEESMYHFLDSSVDAVITDEIELAEEVQERLDGRSDLQIILDKVSGLLE